jgi:hypothetical protein
LDCLYRPVVRQSRADGARDNLRALAEVYEPVEYVMEPGHMVFEWVWSWNLLDPRHRWQRRWLESQAKAAARVSSGMLTRLRIRKLWPPLDWERQGGRLPA